jgi:hypothetical protein
MSDHNEQLAFWERPGNGDRGANEAEVPLYRVAPAAGVHPARLGAMLSGKLPLPPKVAERVEAALARELATGRQPVEPVEA